MTPMTEEKAYKKEKADIEVERPIASSPSAILTLEQATKLANGRPFELLKGRMVFKMPDYDHSQTQALLCAHLFNYFLANPVGRVLTELTHRFWPDNAYEGRMPDLSIILNEHLELGERYPTRAPDIAVEIISSDDAWTKLFEKARLYFEKGSREVWLVDPYEKGALVLTPTARRWEWNTLTSPELLPGLQIELSQIFTWPNAPAPTAPKPEPEI